MRNIKKQVKKKNREAFHLGKDWFCLQSKEKRMHSQNHCYLTVT